MERIRDAASGCFSFFYDKQSGLVMGRTGKSWLLILIFYVIYYIVLACFFGGMLNIFLFTSIKREEPYRSGKDSLMDLNPGLGFRPQPDVTSTLIKYQIGSDNNAKYVEHLKTFFKKNYEDISSKFDGKYAKCDSTENGTLPEDPMKTVCGFDPAVQLGPCGDAAKKYGYTDGKTCVIIKLNKIYGWLPDIFDTNFAHPLVRCYGENAADKENIGNPNYYPSVNGISTGVSTGKSVNVTLFNGEPGNYGYFNNAFFPFLKQKGYVAPLVAVEFADIRRNVLVMVACQLYNLKNSEYNKLDKAAMVRFEVLVEDKP